MNARHVLDVHMRRMFALRALAVGNVRKLAEQHGFSSPDFVAGAVEIVLAAQTEEALATWAHLSMVVALADLDGGGEIEADLPLDAVIGAVTHKGTPLETVYRRPGIRAAKLLADGFGVAEIFDAIVPGLDLAVSSDVAMAGRLAEQAYGAADQRVVGWRRVPNVGACAWCRRIATRRYATGTLAPAHRGCSCGTEPIVG